MQITNSKKSLREFGLLIGIGFPLVFGFIMPAIIGHSLRLWTLIVGIPFLFLGFVKPKLLSYPFKLWMFLGEVLGCINSRLILGLVFFLLLQPIALVMKFIGYDPLKKKKLKTNSYRERIKNRKIDLTRIF